MISSPTPLEPLPIMHSRLGAGAASPSGGSGGSGGLQPSPNPGSGPSRLKRPLLQTSPVSPSSSAKRRKGSQRKGMFINQHNGAKRASFSSLTSPIKTQAEMQLYNTLLPQHTHGSKTNWDGMARAFNDEVIMACCPRLPNSWPSLTGWWPRRSAGLELWTRSWPCVVQPTTSPSP